MASPLSMTSFVAPDQSQAQRRECDEPSAVRGPEFREDLGEVGLTVDPIHIRQAGLLETSGSARPHRDPGAVSRVVVHKNETGELLSTRSIDNDWVNLAAAVSDAGDAPEVILEAAYGWH